MSKKSQSQINLECLVKAHIDATADRAIVKRDLVNLPPPVCPKAVSSLSELKKYSNLRKKFEAQSDQLDSRVVEIDGQIKALEKDIIALIPVKCVWVRAGDYAVSYYHDCWGGGHYDIEIKKWRDNLPEQKDKTYYP